MILTLDIQILLKFKLQKLQLLKNLISLKPNHNFLSCQLKLPFDSHFENLILFQLLQINQLFILNLKQIALNLLNLEPNFKLIVIHIENLLLFLLEFLFVIIINLILLLLSLVLFSQVNLIADLLVLLVRVDLNEILKKLLSLKKSVLSLLVLKVRNDNRFLLTLFSSFQKLIIRNQVQTRVSFFLDFILDILKRVNFKPVNFIRFLKYVWISFDSCAHDLNQLGSKILLINRYLLILRKTDCDKSAAFLAWNLPRSWCNRT